MPDNLNKEAVEMDASQALDAGKLVEALRKRAVRLRDAEMVDRVEAHTEAFIAANDLERATYAIEALQARVEALEAGLRPFARYVTETPERGQLPDKHYVVGQWSKDCSTWIQVLWSDFRRAAALLPVDGGERG